MAARISRSSPFSGGEGGADGVGLATTGPRYFGTACQTLPAASDAQFCPAPRLRRHTRSVRSVPQQECRPHLLAAVEHGGLPLRCNKEESHVILAHRPEARAQRDELLPIVRFAVTQRLDEATADYWDHATLLELAVLASDKEAAREFLGKALIAVRENWEPKTTARNLGLIRDARGDGQPWLDDIIAELEERAK